MLIKKRKDKPVELSSIQKKLKKKHKLEKVERRPLHFNKGSYQIRLPKEVLDCFGWKDKDRISIRPEIVNGNLTGALRLYHPKKYPLKINYLIYDLQLYLKDVQKMIRNRKKYLHTDTKVDAAMKKAFGYKTVEEALKGLRKQEAEIKMIIKWLKTEITGCFEAGHEDLPDDLEELKKSIGI